MTIILESKLNTPYTIDFANSYSETKDKIAREKYDLLILDISMPDSIFKEMIKELKSIQNTIKIMIFSSHGEDVAMQYIEEGAEGYLNKNSSEIEILNAVNTILEVGHYYNSKLMDEILNGSKNPVKKLSKREFQVFKLIVEGYKNTEISKILDLQLSTISTHKNNVLKKLNAKTVIELVRIDCELH